MSWQSPATLKFEVNAASHGSCIDSIKALSCTRGSFLIIKQAEGMLSVLAKSRVRYCVALSRIDSTSNSLSESEAILTARLRRDSRRWRRWFLEDRRFDRDLEERLSLRLSLRDGLPLRLSSPDAGRTWSSDVMPWEWDAMPWECGDDCIERPVDPAPLEWWGATGCTMLGIVALWFGRGEERAGWPREARITSWLMMSGFMFKIPAALGNPPSCWGTSKEGMIMFICICRRREGTSIEFIIAPTQRKERSKKIWAQSCSQIRDFKLKKVQQNRMMKDNHQQDFCVSPIFFLWDKDFN